MVVANFLSCNWAHWSSVGAAAAAADEAAAAAATAAAALSCAFGVRLEPVDGSLDLEDDQEEAEKAE